MAVMTWSKPCCCTMPEGVETADPRELGGIRPPEMDAVVRPTSWLATGCVGTATGGLDAVAGDPEGGAPPPFTDGGLFRLPARLKLHSMTPLQSAMPSWQGCSFL